MMVSRKAFIARGMSGFGMKRKLEEEEEPEPEMIIQPPQPGKITLLDEKQAKMLASALEAKRKRMMPFERVIRQKREVITILMEAGQFIAEGNMEECLSSLREFSTDHMSTLHEFDQLTAIELMMSLLRGSRLAEVGKVVMRMIYSIMKRMDEDGVKKAIEVIFQKVQGEDISSFSFVDGEVVAVMEMAVRREIVNDLSLLPPSFDVIVKRAERDPIDPMKRREAIRWRVACGVMKVTGHESSRSLQSFLCHSTRDRDERVRMIGLEGLMEVKEILVENYGRVKELCRDSQSSVRIASLQLIHRFALAFPNHDVTPPSSSSTSSSRMILSDDAFCEVCNAANDMEVEVRSLALSLLGLFEVVSESYLDQTLDKKLMKMKTSDSGAAIGVRTKDSLFSIRKRVKRREDSEWASGKELNEVARGEKEKRKEKEEESIMPQGACGAFITALEDEFMCVRRSAVYSLGKLASTRPAFAAAALDHLADMFNDEIEEVRLDSINALTPLVSRGELFKEQLETIIKCLDDATPVSREALRRLLEKAKFGDMECIRICVRSLLLCMKRYPMDKGDIMQTMSLLGRSHSSLVHPLVGELLHIHPVFDSQEKSLQDEQYVAKLVLVLNAASEFEPVVSLLPAYVKRHFRYMRCALPHLVPKIKGLESREKGEAERNLSILREKWKGTRGFVLEEVYTRLLAVQEMGDAVMRRKTRKYIVEDLEAIASFNVALSSPSRLLTAIVSLLNSVDGSNLENLLSHPDGDEIHESIEKELWGVECIQDGIAALPHSAQAFLIETRLHLVVYHWIVSLLRRPLSYNVVLEDMKRHVEQYQLRFSSSPSLVQSESSTQLTAGLAFLLTSGKVISTDMLIDLILAHPPALPPVIEGMERVRVKWAKILEPEKDLSMERPHRFVSLLPSSVQFVADIHELEDRDEERIRIKMDYPDGQSSLHRPRIKDWSTMDEKTLRLRTQVLVAVSSAWSEAASITLSLVLLPSSSSLSSPSSRPIPLSSSPSSFLPSSVTIKIQPMTNAGGQTNPGGMGTRPGVRPM